MRGKITLFIVLALLFTSCQIIGSKAEKNNNHNSGKTTIVGQWQWLKSTGGFAGGTYTPDSKGYGNYTISFSADYKYSEMRADTIAYSGIYSWTKDVNDKTILKIQVAGMVTLYANVTIQNNDTLILMDTSYDGYISTYKRLY